MLAVARDHSARLALLLGQERSSLVQFILELAEFERRKHWRELGHASLFNYLRHELHLSEATAYYRMTAVDLVQRFPQLVQPLRDGRLCITSVVELRRALTAENCDDVLPRFFHRSSRETKALAAALAPAADPPARDVVIALPVPPPVVLAAPAEPASSPSPSPSPPPPPLQTVKDSSEPLTATLHRMHLTVSSEVLAKLERAKAALSHKYPEGRLEDVLSDALDALLERDARRKGLTDRPRAANDDEPTGRYVRARVRREVWTRDEGCCQWPLDSGGICGSTHQVQIDHIDPYARGGRSIASNLRLLCAVHNAIAAQRTFGEAFMAKWRSTSGA